MIDNIAATLNKVTGEHIVAALTIACILVMLFNRKINVVKVFVEQLKIFKNNRTQKVSFWDILSFIVCPLLLSLIMVTWYEFSIKKELAQILTTAFSLIFTLLLAFETILVGKKNSTNEVEREVINQTFISAVSSSVFTLTGIILSITIMFVSNGITIKILTTIILTLSFATVMLLLMIIKRTFKIFMRDNVDNDK